MRAFESLRMQYRARVTRKFRLTLTALFAGIAGIVLLSFQNLALHRQLAKAAESQRRAVRFAAAEKVLLYQLGVACDPGADGSLSCEMRQDPSESRTPAVVDQ